MANLLVFLRNLVEDGDERSVYRSDRTAYPALRGQDDLTGEDVVAALDVVMDQVPEELARRLGEATVTMPSEAPDPGETPFQAALRTLDHLLAALDEEPPPTPAP